MSDDIGAAIYGTVVAVALAVALVMIGVIFAVISIASDCNDFGKVKLRGDIYECKKDRK